MKGIVKAIGRTLSGDGSPMSPTRGGKRGRRRGEVQNANSAEIFCNDMYTVEYVLDALVTVGKNPEIYNIVLEDLIERNNPKITQAVQDLFVQTTRSAKMSEKEIQAAKDLDSCKDLRNAHRSRSCSPKKGRSLSPMRSSTGKNKAKRRVWKKISFVDCVSDSQSYKVYLSQKRNFVSVLTRFLRIQGFQNDLPVVFEAKIEIHTLLDGLTILELLQAIQRDTTVTRVQFGGALGNKETRVAEEFGKLIDPEQGTVTETIAIRLKYDKQSLNMEHEDEEGGESDNPQSSTSNTPHRRRARRQSQLDASVLNTIRRMAMVLEQRLMPNDLSGSFGLLEMSELSGFSKDDSKKSEVEVKPFKDNSESERASETQEAEPKVKLDLFGNPMDDLSVSEALEISSLKTDRSDIKPFGNGLDASGQSGYSHLNPYGNALDSSTEKSARSEVESGEMNNFSSQEAWGNPLDNSGTGQRSTSHAKTDSKNSADRIQRPGMFKRSITMESRPGAIDEIRPKRSSSADGHARGRKKSPSPPSSPTKKGKVHLPGSPSRSRSRSRSRSPDSPKRKMLAGRMTAMEKIGLLNSANSVTSPIATKSSSHSFNKMPKKSILDDSSRVPRGSGVSDGSMEAIFGSSKSFTNLEEKSSMDDSRGRKGRKKHKEKGMSDDSEAAVLGSDSERECESHVRSGAGDKKEKDGVKGDISATRSNHSSGGRKGRRSRKRASDKDNAPPLRRSSTDEPRAGKGQHRSRKRAGDEDNPPPLRRSSTHEPKAGKGLPRSRRKASDKDNPPPLRRASTQEPPSARRLPRVQKVPLARAKSEDSPKSEIRKCLSLDGTGNLKTADPDFDWEHFEKKKDPSDKKTKGRSVVSR